jgi:tetratricopeptide (TPR) repeat protein
LLLVLVLIGLACAGGLWWRLSGRAPAPSVPASVSDPVPATSNPVPPAQPAAVERVDTPPAAVPAPATTPPPKAPPADLVQREAEKRQADEAMAAWSERHSHLREHGILLWGGAAYGAALGQAQEGDAAVVDQAYPRAAERYRAALAVLDELNSVTNLVAHRLAEEAEHHAASGAEEAAGKSLEGLRQLSPGSALLQQTESAVRRLSVVGARLRAGAAHEAAGRWAQAFVDYQEAATADPAHAGAADALERARRALAELEFKARMAEGFNALRRGDTDRAAAEFAKARDLRPDAPEVREADWQVAEARRNARILALRQSADAALAAEAWDAAHRAYGEALNLDGGLVFAREGRALAERRSRAAQRAEHFLAQPALLDTERGLAEARTAAEEARAAGGGTKMADLAERLDGLVQAASRPSEVTLVSDGATEVAVFRVGKLGLLREHRLELRPGTWTLTGSRPGFRDVRITLRIAPGDPPRRIEVICAERIR